LNISKRFTSRNQQHAGLVGFEYPEEESDVVFVQTKLYARFLFVEFGVTSAKSDLELPVAEEAGYEKWQLAPQTGIM